jgi:hypothetical protein
MLSTWGAEGKNTLKVANIVKLIYEYAFGDIDSEDSTTPTEYHWFKVLSKAAINLVQSSGIERDILLELVQLGRSKKARSFLGDQKTHPPPWFGLTAYNVVIPMLKTAEEKIEALRYVTRCHYPSAPASYAIIQYFENPISANLPEELPPQLKTPKMGKRVVVTASVRSLDVKPYRWVVPDKISRRPLENSKNQIRAFATALTQQVHAEHYRWTENPSSQIASPKLGLILGYQSTQESCLTLAEGMSSITFDHSGPKSSSAIKIPALLFSNGNPFAKALRELQFRPQDGSQTEINSKDVSKVDDERVGFADDPDNLIKRGRPFVSSADRGFYSLALGNPLDAALFILDSNRSFKQRQSFGATTMEMFEALLEQKHFDRNQLRVAIRNVGQKPSALDSHAFFDSLAAIGVAAEVHKSLGSGSISPSIVNSPLKAAKWFKRFQSSGLHFANDTQQQQFLLKREEILSCISYFDQGLDIDTVSFRTVMAISSTDSIYVASELLSDPLEREHISKVRRILGNIGKPGLNLLIPPAAPRCLKPNPDDWQLIEYEPYQGVPTDSFSSTNLNMSFTGWRIPMDLADARRGQQDAQAYIYEALISVYDRGKWIADLDVLDALSKGSRSNNSDTDEFCYEYEIGWLHKDDMNTRAGVVDNEEVPTINNWQELLDHPAGPVIVMAYKNWAARLAVTCLAIRRQDKVYVLDKFCWTCLENLKENVESVLENAIFIC